ncbi:MAG: tetratricopeptide repeat protein [Acidobacteria bacterium]|nr:tetratricopeptide repeat protein [Acidobacteriota bacterium]
MIICPILSQQRRGEDGSTTWEHHECIEDGCAFWAAEAKDCSLRASGFSILRREAAEAAAPAAVPLPAPDLSTILEAPLARLADVERKLQELGDRSAAASRDLGIRLLEGVAALEQPVNALRDEVGRLHSRFEETAGTLAQASAVIEEHRRREDLRTAEEARAEAAECNARGMALFHRGAFEAGEAAFRRAVDLDGGLAEAHNNLGLALSRLGRPDEAVGSFERALQIRPDLAAALNNLGFMMHEGSRFEEAVDLFRRAAVTGRDASAAYTNLGNACYRLSRRTEAVDAWRKALESDPLNEDAARGLRLFEGAEASR